MSVPSQYDNPKLWVLVSSERGKDYVSVAAQVPTRWTRGYSKQGKMIYTFGQYTILRHKADGPYTVFRMGVELPLSFYGRLKDAKERAVKNARGGDRMHVA